MDTSPRSRAPPPSPAAREKPESSEDDDLDRFMKRSLRVPNLILPDRIVQREIVVRNPPEIDWASLISPLSEKSVARELRSSAAAIGCVQLVNHSIPRDLIEEAAVAVGDAFGTTPEEKKKAARSPERRWGFEAEEEEKESFWWDGTRLEEMAGIGKWSSNDFRDKMGRLWIDMEKICIKIMEILKDNNMHINNDQNGEEEEVNEQVSYLCVHKHCKVGGENENKNYNKNYNEKYEMMMLRVLMRSWGCSHGLALHVPSNASKFQVYFKKGWLSFTPTKDALVLTLGDQLQKCSGGFYKHAIGKQVLVHQSDKNGTSSSSSSSIISMAFFYSLNASPSSSSSSSSLSLSSITNSHKEKTISLSQQLMVATFLTLLFHLFVYLFV